MDKLNVLLLAAGLGTRLQPLTNDLPKCLMPINKIPLLEIWFESLRKLSIDSIFVNLHYMKEKVESLLNRPIYKNMKIVKLYEDDLLGTAGTITANYPMFKNSNLMVIHADNYCLCDFQKFIDYHFEKNSRQHHLTLMTFETTKPEECGIVEIDDDSFVIDFHEKKKNPPGFLANAAVYILTPHAIDEIYRNSFSDFSNEVIPYFKNSILTWQNRETMIDIGTIERLKEAQTVFHDVKPTLDTWYGDYLQSEIHSFL